MKKLVSIFLVLLCLSCAAQAESVWVEENWQHVYREVDCDGLPMVIDADVMQQPDGTMAQEYHIDLLSNDYCRQKMQKIDWEKIGFSTENMTWLADFGWSGISGENTLLILRSGEIEAAKRKNIFNYLLIDENKMYMMDMMDLPHLTYAEIDRCAETVAEMLNFKIGMVCRGQRMDKEEISRQLKRRIELAEAIGTHYDELDDIDDEEIAASEYFDVYYPVYYNGMRLYSDNSVALPGETQLLTMSLHLKVTANGIVYLNAPLINELKLKDAPKLAMTSEMAIETLVNAYSDMYLPGIESITVKEIVLEYCAMTADQNAEKGYTMYPAWVVRSVMTYQGGQEGLVYNAFHAITGKQLY